jgi:hypothetical protein
VKRQRGHGLILALVVMVVMMTALGVLAASMRLRMSEVQRELRTVSLVALTDAAMAETLAHLARSRTYPGVPEYRFGGGLIASEVTSLGTRRVEVLAQASFAGRSRSMRAEVLLTPSGPRVVRLRN